LIIFNAHISASRQAAPSAVIQTPTHEGMRLRIND
jgi:hypothetical protein